MKKLLVIIILAGMVFAGTVLSLDKSKIHADLAKFKAFFSNPKQHIRNRVDLLFVQQADSGSMEVDKNKPNCYTLRLSNLHKNVLYFSDRPRRKAGQISVPAFTEMWKHDHTRPNVAMQAFTASREDIKEISLVATLSNPKYNTKTQTMTYTACPIANSNKMIAHLNLLSVNLFIDPMQQWPE